MPQIEKLVELNTKTAEAVTSRSEMDNFAAELVLRNTSVAADRLSPLAFSHLSKGTVDKVLDTVAIANELAPQEPIEKQRMPHETDADYQYRTVIAQPLNSFQRKIANGDFNKDPDSKEMHKIQAGIILASEAFASMIEDSAHDPAITSTERYFWGNINAAARRLDLRQ